MTLHWLCEVLHSFSYCFASGSVFLVFPGNLGGKPYSNCASTLRYYSRMCLSSTVPFCQDLGAILTERQIRLNFIKQLALDRVSESGVHRKVSIIFHIDIYVDVTELYVHRDRAKLIDNCL